MRPEIAVCAHQDRRVRFGMFRPKETCLFLRSIFRFLFSLSFGLAPSSPGARCCFEKRCVAWIRDCPISPNPSTIIFKMVEDYLQDAENQKLATTDFLFGPGFRAAKSTSERKNLRIIGAPNAPGVFVRSIQLRTVPGATPIYSAMRDSAPRGIFPLTNTRDRSSSESVAIIICNVTDN